LFWAGLVMMMLLLTLLPSPGNGIRRSNTPNYSSASSRSRSTKQSYYDILGVPKTATDKEIKKAYRKLAIQHHPDKGGNEDTFKEISKAYQTLSNPDEKAIYDQYGEAGLEMGRGPNAANYGFGATEGNPFGNTNNGANPFQGFFSSQGYSGPGFHTETFSFGDHDGNIDLSDLLRQMMGGNPFVGGNNNPFQQQQRQQQTDGTARTFTRPLRCTLEDLAKGTTKQMKLTFQGKEKIYKIPIKPGWKAGTKITFPGQWSTGIPTMIFEVEEIPHKFLRRQGNDLLFVCWIDESQTKGGIQVTVPLPSGDTYQRKIPKMKSDDRKGSASILSNGEKLVIPNKGMPIKGGPERGDLVIEFRVRRGKTSSSSSSKPR
jgi:DnaJ homolog subfamily B member 4